MSATVVTDGTLRQMLMPKDSPTLIAAKQGLLTWERLNGTSGIKWDDLSTVSQANWFDLALDIIKTYEAAKGLRETNDS